MSQKVIALAFSAASQQSWVADADYVLAGAVSSVAGAIAFGAWDASIAVADVSTPSATKLVPDMVFIIPSSKPSPQMNVPVISGSTLYVRAGGAMMVLLYLEPSIPAE